MRDFLILTKALYKANYGMDLKSKQGRKGIIAMVVLVVCLLPTFALIFNMFLEGFRLHSFDLMIMEMGFACLCFLMLWTALFVFPSVFYFSNDLEHLLVLPISGKTIVASKFVIVYISLMLVACIGMLPILVAYIMAGNASISSILFYIPQIFLIGLPTTLIVCIFWMILMRLLPFFKNKDRFNMITGILSIGLAIVIGLASSQLGYNAEDPVLVIQTMANDPEGIMRIVQIFFNVSFAARSIVESSMVDFLITILILAICMAVFLFLADKLYLSSARDARTSVSSKKKKVSYRKQGSVWINYAKVELLRLTRTPAYMANCVLSSLVMPIMFIAMMVVTPIKEDLRPVLETVDIPSLINLPLVLLIAGAAIGFFAGSLNGISATAFSREGKNLDFVKYVPLDFTKQVLIKESIGILFSLLTCVLMLISVHIVVPYPLWYDLFFVLGAFITSVLVNAIAIFVDGLHPKTDWEDETHAIKNNMNVILEFVISWAILAIVMVPFFMFNLSAYWEVYSIAMLILLTLLSVLFVLVTPKIILKHLMRSSS